MKKIKIIICLIVLTFTYVNAQNSDSKYARPLKDVLKELEDRFHVTLRISDKDVDGKILNYAEWRIRPYSLEESLKNVLAPFDFMYLPDSKPNSYKIQGYQYHRRTVEEGGKTLEYLASLYNSKEEWETRRSELKKEIKEAVQLSPMPERVNGKPVLTKVRKKDGYTIQNMALEVLPGFYVCGSIYRPSKIKGKIPVVLCPNGHFGGGRYNKDVQIRCAGLARMGAVAVNYDLFGWGESSLQVGFENHRTSMANTIQALNSTRILDYLLSFKYADTSRVGITGGSGGGSHTMLMSALDDRIDVSVPVVMMSAIHYGGCPGESGNPIHLCGGGTNNVEIAGLFAPKPQLVVSDGGDWTANVPVLEFPFLKRIYDFYPGSTVENVHLPNEHHDYGPSKRIAMYHFMAKELGLDESQVFDKNGELDESAITVEKDSDMKVFGDNGENLPDTAVRSFEELVKVFMLEKGKRNKDQEQ